MRRESIVHCPRPEGVTPTSLWQILVVNRSHTQSTVWAGVWVACVLHSAACRPPIYPTSFIFTFVVLAVRVFSTAASGETRLL